MTFGSGGMGRESKLRDGRSRPKKKRSSHAAALTLAALVRPVRLYELRWREG